MVERRRLFTDQQLIELYDQGFNDPEIAEKLGVNKAIVGYHRRRLGLEALGRRPLFTDEQLIELHDQGFKDREIADMFGTTPSVVGYHRRRLGLEALGRRLLFTDQQLIELHEQDLNDTEKGEKLGANSSTVNLRRARLGLEPIRKHGINYLLAKRKFTDEELIALHERGYSDRLMGKKLGAHESTVGYHRRRLSLKRIRKHKR